MQKLAEKYNNYLCTAQWLRFYRVFLYFFSFSIFGWLVETVCVVVAYHRMPHRGLILYGIPAVPLYGFCGLMILFILEPALKKHPIRLFLVATVLMTMIEYFISIQDELISHKRTWDYSSLPMNFQGRVQLFVSLFWGVITLLAVYVINPTLKKWVKKVRPPVAGVFTWLLLPYTACCSIYDYVLKQWFK